MNSKKTMHKLTAALLASTLLLSACGSDAPPAGDASSSSTSTATGSATVNPALQSALKNFERRIDKVTEGVYQAVGYAAANSIMIEGDDGVIIVDVTGSVERGREVKAAFAEITDKPIVALIYTHNHGDHVFGGPGFVADGDVEVYAHDSTDHYIDRVVNLVAPAIGARSNRMMGAMLPVNDEGFVHFGIGPFIETTRPGNHPDVLRPTKTFSDQLELTIAGVNIQLVHAPGETDDQLFVWLPDHKVLMPGDNIYKSFPNLYTLRGTQYRDVSQWYRSIDTMRRLEPEYLVPSHTQAISGREQVMEVLTAYRDGIQFVHDQTLRGINQGLTPEQLVETVKLPPHLAEHPYLQEHYGTVAWSVRNIYTGYMGWYDGNVAKLYPVPLQQRAEQMAALAGGSDALLDKAQQAVSEGRYRWALELSDHLLLLELDQQVVRQLRADASRALGYAQHNANARNVYLTDALEMERRGSIDSEALKQASSALIKRMPVKGFIESLAVNLNPAASLDSNAVMGLRFTDTGETFGIHVRRGVAEVTAQFPRQADHVITTTTAVWLQIMAGELSLPMAMINGDIALQGGRLQIPATLAFLAMFRE